jgi:hypothetical protein
MRYKNQVISGVVSIALVALLVFAGPASALNFSIDGLQNVYYRNQPVEFTATFDINSNQQVDVNSVSLELGRPGNSPNAQWSTLCVFDMHGNSISGCQHVNVTLISNSTNNGYGYGYGYGYGNGDRKLVYKIVIDREHPELTVKRHSVRLTADTSAGTFQIRDEFTISNGNPTNPKGIQGAWGNNGQLIQGLSFADEGQMAGTYTAPQTTEKDSGTVLLQVDPPATKPSGITGAVIGTLRSSSTWIVVVFIALVIGAFVAVRAMRKKPYKMGHFDYY